MSQNQHLAADFSDISELLYGNFFSKPMLGLMALRKASRGIANLRAGRRKVTTYGTGTSLVDENCHHMTLGVSVLVCKLGGITSRQ